MLNKIREHKKILREEFLKERASISLAERDRISNEIIQKFLSMKIYRDSKIIMAYASTQDEIQLSELFTACFADHKILSIPFILGKGEMLAVKVPDFNSLMMGKFDILTVREPRTFIKPEQIDCVIVPGAAFDEKFNRLGLGGGYYDKFLPLAVNAKKIAFAYDFQIVKTLPVESHDEAIDIILSPTKIIQRN